MRGRRHACNGCMADHGLPGRWFGHLPMDVTSRLVEEKRIFFHTAMDFDPWWCIGPSLGESIELFMDTESDLCGRPLHAAAQDKVCQRVDLVYPNLIGLTGVLQLLWRD